MCFKLNMLANRSLRTVTSFATVCFRTTLYKHPTKTQCCGYPNPTSETQTPTMRAHVMIYMVRHLENSCLFRELAKVYAVYIALHPVPSCLQLRQEFSIPFWATFAGVCIFQSPTYLWLLNTVYLISPAEKFHYSVWWCISLLARFLPPCFSWTFLYHGNGSELASQELNLVILIKSENESMDSNDEFKSIICIQI